MSRGGQKSTADPLALYLQVVVSCLSPVGMGSEALVLCKGMETVTFIFEIRSLTEPDSHGFS